MGRGHLLGGPGERPGRIPAAPRPSWGATAHHAPRAAARSRPPGLQPELENGQPHPAVAPSRAECVLAAHLRRTARGSLPRDLRTIEAFTGEPCAVPFFSVRLCSAKKKADCPWHRPQLLVSRREETWQRLARCMPQMYHPQLWERYLGRPQQRASDVAEEVE